ncbi:ATP-binding protein [Lutibacter sp.]
MKENNKETENKTITKLLLNEADILVVSYNRKGEVTYISSATEKLIGYKPKKLLGDRWWNLTFFSKEESKLFKDKITGTISGEREFNPKPYRRKLKCENEKVKWIEWRDSLSENKIVSVGIDITYWKKKEASKIQSDKILENVNSLVMVSNNKDEIIYSSPSVKKMLGYEVEEIMGDKWWNVTYDNKQEAIKTKEAINNYVNFNIKNFVDISKRKIKARNGEYKWIEWHISKGANDTYISVGTDITDRILTDIELKKAKESAEESLKVKNEFLANMSHEIRTPLNAIIGFTDLLLETKLTTEQKLHLETMQNSGEILLSLINDVLDLSKLESGKLETEVIPFNLHKQLNEVVRLMKIKAREKNISLNLEIDKNTPKQVIGDPTRLGQILLNLIGNAIKFTNKGSVTVSVKQLKESTNSTTVFFEIKDTGIGIVSNKINTVFGAFTQAKSDTSRIYGGTGLGLTIVKKLVSLLNGQITVESKFGKGSVFKFTLPLQKGSNKITVEEYEEELSMDKPLNLDVLLVDDNKTNQLLGKTRLERWGCNVDLANNGIEGVKKTQQKLYDVILMDIQMPIMDGYEATKIIKNDISEQVSKIPVIAMTAYTSKNDIKRAINAGMDDYIFKPFKPVEVYKLLKKYGKISEENNNKVPEIIEKQIKSESKKYIDLKFIREETMNESSILALLIESFINDIDEFLEILDKGFKSKNWKLLHEATHKIKPSIRMFGISKLDQVIHDLVNRFREEKRLNNVDERINLCKRILKDVKIELLTELKLLKDE